jgi:hypothetical protein
MKCSFVGREMYFDAGLVVAFSCGIAVGSKCVGRSSVFWAHNLQFVMSVRPFVGSRAPIRGGLPLLGPAAGSVGSLRRMSQWRVFRRETSEADFAVSAVE